MANWSAMAKAVMANADAAKAAASGGGGPKGTTDAGGWKGIGGSGKTSEEGWKAAQAAGRAANATPPPDPWAAFDKAYAASPQAALFGNIAALKADMKRLAELPNELFMLIPDDFLIAHVNDLLAEQPGGVRRLDSLPNEKLESLIQANKNMIGSINMARLAQMNRPFVDSVVIPFLAADPARKTMLDALRATLAAAGTGGQSGTGPSIRSLRDIVKDVTPGSALDLNALGMNAQEIDRLFFNEGLPDPANIMRAMGYEPNQGNPNVAFLESLIPKLGRQSELYRSYVGDLASGPSDPTWEKMRKGAESQSRLLGDVSGQMSQGATSAVTPQLGASFLKDLVGKMGLTAEERKNLGQENLFTQLVDQKNAGAPDAAFQAVMDLIGGGLSPMLMGQPGLQRRMRDRLQEDWRNSGTGGGSFLSWLSRLVPGAA